MSNAIATFTYKPGEDIFIPFTQDTPTSPDVPVIDGTETVYCDLKVASTGTRVPPSSAEIVYSLIPTFEAETESHGARWMLTIPASVSATLAPRRYIADVQVEFSGITVKSAPIIIDLDQAVTNRV